MTEPRADLAPADSRVRYLERCSQFPVVGAPIGAGLVAAGEAGAAALPGPGVARDLMGVVTFLAAVYLLIVLIGMPYGIEIAAGRFAVGARGPALPLGPAWRRVTGPLEAVRSWEILTTAEARLLRRERRTRLPSGRRLMDVGDMRLFRQRQYLRLVVDPGSAAAYFSAKPVRRPIFRKGRFGRGLVWDGTVVIGTRRPVALAAALDQALPGRRSRLTAQAGVPGM
jgi:hypothetical protein